MKKKISLFLLIFTALIAEAQSNNNIYGIVRKNYFSWIVDPFDSTNFFEQFDSCTIRLGSVNPNTGVVSNVGNITYQQSVNLTGATLNPYTNAYVFCGAGNINSFNLTTGMIDKSAMLSNPIAASYFDNFRFNNADSTIYGLARRNYTDPVTMITTGEVYLAKVNELTGVITQISPTSISQGFALAGSVIDPYQMMCYYSTGAQLQGIDLYTGNIISSANINNVYGTSFDNITYSCADSSIYGLIRKNYFSYYIDSILGQGNIQILDSSAVYLGKINPVSGVVTKVSPYSLQSGGYTLNGSCTIDPNTMTYYYNNGSSMVGVSLVSGQVVSTNPYIFNDGQYFELMRNYQNCISAVVLRKKNQAVSIANNVIKNDLSIYPNPTNNVLHVQNNELIKTISITDMHGKVISITDVNDKQKNIDVQGLAKGLYIVRTTLYNNTILVNKIIKD
jgi:Secretion system C-terminal sorting domain